MHSTPTTTPTSFESFNARNLSPIQVAKSFIPPTQFEELIQRQHSIVIGPRGSGKTTLLKMLQPTALATWSHREAERIKSSIDFTAVFIATDVSWGAQLDAMGTNKIPKDIREKLGRAAFVTHVLISFIETVKNCAALDELRSGSLSRLSIDLNKNIEAQFVKLVSENWELSPALPSLQGLIFSLRNRLSDIAKFALKEADTEPEAIQEITRNTSYLHLSFIESLIFGIEVLGSLTDDEHRRWAFLFDELEIAPRQIRRILFRSLRSADQRLLFKLSISPYSEDIELLENSTSAMSYHDYQKIELWYPRKESAVNFCNELFSSILKSSGVNDKSAADVFGYSEFEPEDSDAIGYSPDSKNGRKFLSLYEKDDTFQIYINKHNIDIKNLHKLYDTRRASTIRKVTSIVTVREAYKGKSRKNPDVYAGAKSIFAIVEGNPRWFIGLTTQLVREYTKQNVTVDRAIQAKSILSASNRFRAQLRTIPYKTNTIIHPKGLLGLLDPIGSSFRRIIIDDEFEPEPPLSFIVDSSTSEDIIDALGKALNAGAIIYVPQPDDDPILTSLKGKRFRLSYMLAPHYKLPLLLGSHISLRRIITPFNQQELFSSHG
ncbi:MAG: hypothetical protein HGB26_02395 [Desulfobulbaceae bacterium]|nr:hypothetical protein [Desulfobulbaceae bacterium]